MRSESRGHAVVLGGSIAGLLAARVLSDSYGQVTVLERDQVAGVADPRRAIPQGHHIHALLARGQEILEELFPGFTDELMGMGVPTGDYGTTLSWYFNGRMIAKTETGMLCVAAGRPFLEERIRNRVLGSPSVTLVEGVDIHGLLASERGTAVTGVRVSDRAGDESERSIEADLVVDATGRGSRTPVWLEELGYSRVPEERVKMDLTYTTQDFVAPLPYDPIGDDIAIIPVATPLIPRGAIFARLRDRFALSLTGIRGDRPPADRDGFLAYARSLPVPEVYESIRQAEPLGMPMSFRFPTSVRRRYERLSRFPAGLLVLGDAACVFNPVYGQGMTVAAIEALVLRRHLQGAGPLRPEAFFRELASVIDAPWDMSAGTDLTFPGVEGRRTVRGRLITSYVERLQDAAVHDGRLSSAFLRAAGLVEPPQTLMRPSVVSRVVRGQMPRSRPQERQEELTV